MRLKKSKKKIRDSKSVRFSELEYNQAMQKAELYCDGNFAEWVRYASANCVPKKKDLEKSRA